MEQILLQELHQAKEAILLKISPFLILLLKVKDNSVEISGIFVPAPFFLNAAKEAIDNGIKLLVAIPEHVPIIDSIKILDMLKKEAPK